ncbi:Protein argonaute 1 [Grifola frondosa]|uniref:Protein argonaute 1 n=1 Tax=Grifola frondosa TaxID=5627 RepID=A0A1C7M131_GRIFR|nr:Protein argonaute 1 [Grifola frondosa]
MSQRMLTMYMGYREKVERKAPAPKRIIFYRDGVSEGQFKHVLEQELPLLKSKFKSHIGLPKFKINPTITMVVVGKRHHVRFFPKRPSDADRSGNVLLVQLSTAKLSIRQSSTSISRATVDKWCFSYNPLQVVTNNFPAFAIYAVGTSRPAHYSVLYDENHFSPDGLQALSFALCHVYARSSVPYLFLLRLYYADIVCSRAKIHYDPEAPNFEFSDIDTQLDDAQANRHLEAFKSGFKPLHATMQRLINRAANVVVTILDRQFWFGERSARVHHGLRAWLQLYSHLALVHSGPGSRNCHRYPPTGAKP